MGYSTQRAGGAQVLASEDKSCHLQQRCAMARQDVECILQGILQDSQ